jgi:hypothetical protein
MDWTSEKYRGQTMRRGRYGYAISMAWHSTFVDDRLDDRRRGGAKENDDVQDAERREWQ